MNVLYNLAVERNVLYYCVTRSIFNEFSGCCYPKYGGLGTNKRYKEHIEVEQQIDHCMTSAGSKLHINYRSSKIATMLTICIYTR